MGAQMSVSANVHHGDDIGGAVAAGKDDGAMRAKAFKVCSVSSAHISYPHVLSSALTEHAHAALETGMLL